MDNLAAHRSAAAREAIRRVGAELCFLPPYRPDPNPIEMAFSKFNTDLKRRAARAVTELREAIGHATDIFTPTCAAIVGVLREREHVALNERRFDGAGAWAGSHRVPRGVLRPLGEVRGAAATGCNRAPTHRRRARGVVSDGDGRELARV